MDFQYISATSRQLSALLKKLFTSEDRQYLSVDIWTIKDMVDLIKSRIPKEAIAYVILTYREHSTTGWQRVNEYAFVTSDGSFLSDGKAPILSDAIPAWITQISCEPVIDEI
jgi:hypothetical protein